MRKKWIILLLCIFLLVGCKAQTNQNKKQDSNKMIHEHCVRTGTLEGGEVSLQYDVYYTGEKLNLVFSEETVISSSEQVLNNYENAYRSIHQNYKDLKYYDTEIVRNTNSVTSKMTIHYDQIDLEQLLRIEGNEDNVVEDGIAKIEKWKALAKRLGASCQVVED